MFANEVAKSADEFLAPALSVSTSSLVRTRAKVRNRRSTDNASRWTKLKFDFVAAERTRFAEWEQHADARARALAEETIHRSRDRVQNEIAGLYRELQAANFQIAREQFHGLVKD